MVMRMGGEGFRQDQWTCGGRRRVVLVTGYVCQSGHSPVARDFVHVP
jgi:hypothetical protein